MLKYLEYRLIFSHLDVVPNSVRRDAAGLRRISGPFADAEGTFKIAGCYKRIVRFLIIFANYKFHIEN